MSFYLRATAGFLLINFLVIAALYFIFPFLGINVQPFNSVSFIILIAICILSAGAFVFFITKKFTKKIKQERAIAEQLVYRYQSISNAADDAIWDYDMVTGKVYYNAQIQNLFGYTSEEMTSNDLWWEKNIHNEDVERVLNKMNSMLASGKNIWRDEYRFKCKNGEYKTVYDRSFIVRNEADIPVRLIGSMIDITGFKQKEQAANQTAIQQQRLASLAIVKEGEEEKRKWRYQLNEDIVQVLAASKLQLRAGGNNTEQLKLSIEHIEEAIAKVKSLSDEIRPGLLDDLGLVETVNDKLSTIKQTVPVLIDFNYESFDQNRLNETVALLLYRIIKEQTEDVIANTDASFIRIVLTNTATEKARLCITDNRMSKRANDADKSLSFEEIKNYVYLLNGNFKVVKDKLQEFTLIVEV